jgi:hypothetical protein
VVADGFEVDAVGTFDVDVTILGPDDLAEAYRTLAQRFHRATDSKRNGVGGASGGRPTGR